jgi:hypothetical protein
MITVKIAPQFFQSLFREGNSIPQSIVTEGLPSGAYLVNARYVGGEVLLDFEGASGPSKEMRVVFSVPKVKA